MDKLQRLYEQIEQAPAYSKEVEDFKLWVLVMIRKAMEVQDADQSNAVSRQAVLDQTYLWSKDEFLRVTNPFDYLRKRINALPPVTPKPTECEDAVSRADTLQRFESYCEKNCQYSKKQRDVMCGACMMGDAIEIVENLPSVTPKPLDSVLDEIGEEIKQLPTKTRTNWDGCLPDIDYPEIEYVDVTKATLLEIIDKYKEGESE